LSDGRGEGGGGERLPKFWRGKEKKNQLGKIFFWGDRCGKKVGPVKGGSFSLSGRGGRKKSWWKTERARQFRGGAGRVSPCWELKKMRFWLISGKGKVKRKAEKNETRCKRRGGEVLGEETIEGGTGCGLQKIVRPSKR